MSGLGLHGMDVDAEPPASGLKIGIIHYTVSPVVGGVESTIDAHALFLRDCGFEVHVMAGRGRTPGEGIRFHDIPEMDSKHPAIGPISRQLSKAPPGPGFRELMNRLLARLSPIMATMDLVLIHNALTLHKNIVLTAALKRLVEEVPCRVIAWAHDLAWEDPAYATQLHEDYPWCLLKQAWSGVDYVAVSERGRNRVAELLGLPRPEIRVIRPGVQIERFLGLSGATLDLIRRNRLQEASPLIILPSRLVRRKNIELGIQATAALVSQYYPRAQLIVTGPPDPHDPEISSYVEQLLALRQSLGVEKHVHFLSVDSAAEEAGLSYEVTAELFRFADLVVFPSWQEGFGIPIVEAGLARIPVFAADIPSVREVVPDLVHPIRPDSDPQTLAAHISDVLRTDRGYLLRRKMQENFVWPGSLQRELLPHVQRWLVGDRIEAK